LLGARHRAGLAAALVSLVAPVALEAAERPRLVLVVSVDQMRYDYLTRFRPLFQGGFKAVWDRGAIFANAHYEYANTETGPGHSVILTGRHPRHSGIIANAWWDDLTRKWVNVVEDPVQLPVGGTGRGASPANLIGFTLGDVLKKASPASRVVGVATKDRSAVLLAGRRADAAYWYESAHGGFITSTYYMREAPAWLTAWNARRYADRFATQPWTRLLPEEKTYVEYAGEDRLPGEWDNVDVVFPHSLRGKPGEPAFYDDFRRTPFADEMTLDFALAAMDAHGLGQDDATDLLAVGFSATDSIGHTYGPGSQEAMDQILRLDRLLARLLEEVDRRVGPGRTLLALSADHGSLPLVETLRASGKDARRVAPKVIDDAIGAALARRFPDGASLVAAYDTPNVYLDLDQVVKRGLRRADVESAVAGALMGTGLVKAVYTQDQLEAPAADKYHELFRNSFFQPRSPHVMALLSENIYLASYAGGTGHGTAYEYDRHVPVVFMGPGVKPGVYDAAVGPHHLAATLGALIGVDYPLQDADRLLTEAIAR
jgi:predicted AlkP superfamily pyrophosphatase or phosphodiesterase